MTFLKANEIRGLAARMTGRVTRRKSPRCTNRRTSTSSSKPATPKNGLVQFFLMTGMREQEVMYTYGRRQPAHATVRVSHKADRGWTPKAQGARDSDPCEACEESECGRLIKQGLQTGIPHRDVTEAGSSTVEPSRSVVDQDNSGCNVPGDFATRCLGRRSTTVQQWLGHSDMESTMRYLKPSRSQKRGRR